MLPILCFVLKCLGFEFESQLVHEPLAAIKMVKEFPVGALLTSQSFCLERQTWIESIWADKSWLKSWQLNSPSSGTNRHLNGRWAGTKQETKTYAQAREFRIRLAKMEAWTSLWTQEAGVDGYLEMSRWCVDEPGSSPTQPREGEREKILVCSDLFCTLLWFFKVPSREMKMFCVVFLLLTPGVCEDDDDDDVKYISKRNSGRRTALDITWNISFCFQRIHLFVFYVPPFLFCSLYYCLAITHFWTARFYPWWCSDELLMLNLKYASPCSRRTPGVLPRCCFAHFCLSGLLEAKRCVLFGPGTIMCAYFLLRFSQSYKVKCLYWLNVFSFVHL